MVVLPWLASLDGGYPPNPLTPFGRFAPCQGGYLNYGSLVTNEAMEATKETFLSSTTLVGSQLHSRSSGHPVK